MRSPVHQSSRRLLGSLASGCHIIAQPDLATPASAQPQQPNISTRVRNTTSARCEGVFDRRDEAKKDGWIIISMKNDWKRIFAFETSNEGGSDEYDMSNDGSPASCTCPQKKRPG